MKLVLGIYMKVAKGYNWLAEITLMRGVKWDLDPNSFSSTSLSEDISSVTELVSNFGAGLGTISVGQQ